MQRNVNLVLRWHARAKRGHVLVYAGEADLLDSSKMAEYRGPRERIREWDNTFGGGVGV